MKRRRSKEQALTVCSEVCRQDSEGQQQASDALHEQLRWLESSFDSKRPFFLGEQFSLLDISLLPFFLRFPVLQHYRQFSLPQVCQLSLVHALLLALLRAYISAFLYVWPHSNAECSGMCATHAQARYWVWV